MSKEKSDNVSSTNVEEYVERSLQTFLGDPPDTDAQWGYLSALLAVAKEALGQRMDVSPFAEAQELQATHRLTGK